MANQKRGYRPLFWPIVLISVGLIWLLGNLGELGLTSDDTVLVFLTEGPTDSANYRRVVGGNQE